MALQEAQRTARGQLSRWTGATVTGGSPAAVGVPPPTAGTAGAPG